MNNNIPNRSRVHRRTSVPMAVVAMACLAVLLAALAPLRLLWPRVEAQDPIPQLLPLEITAPGTALIVGQSLQLTVLGSSGEDLTLADTGTEYSANNPGIVMVGPDGLVTALAAGGVEVAASNFDLEADVVRAGAISFLVGVAGDADADGLGDDYETAHGLDPFDPTDAPQDVDGDGLTNLEENSLGTDPQNPDSDGDGLLDRAEVALGFDPLTADLAFRLDETWSVTVNGQTVQVNPDGSFRIPNIAAPDQFGAGGPGTRPDFKSDDFLRVVGTKTVDGVTLYAFGEPFQIDSGQIFSIASVTITDRPPPLPVAIEIEAASTVLAIGETEPLTVTATLADGSTADVTPRAAWTVYRTSNPALATVDANGVVTGNGVGSVVITAVNEGATAVKRMTVSSATFLTRLEGFVQFEDGTPAVGADISVLNGSAVSEAPEGFFSIPDLELPAEVMSLSVGARIRVGQESFFGTAAGITPVPGGITDAGVITLRLVEAEFEPDLGANLFQSDDDFDLVQLGFPFPFYGTSQTGIFVGSNGYITFGQGDTDFSESIADHLTPQPRISVFFDDLFPGVAGADRQTYVNQLANPSRAVVTWFQVPEFFNTGSNTLQAILFESGRIQLGYAGMTAIDAVVGLSPGSNPPFQLVDFSSLTVTTSVPGATAIAEQFTGTSPFDLDNGFVIFEPNTSGGYEVTFIPGLVNLMSGAVFGSVTEKDGRPCANAAVEVSVSGDAAYRGRTKTDAAGRYRLEGVPLGSGVRVVVGGRDDLVGCRVVPGAASSVQIDIVSEEAPAKEEPGPLDGGSRDFSKPELQP